MHIPFDNSFFRDMEGFYVPEVAAVPPAPKLLVFNEPLATELGLDIADSGEAELARLFSGAKVPAGANPIALAYAGHQFGHFSSQLGDGRALLLGEVVAPLGQRYDIQLKGSGPTAFSRNGDGKAAIGPVLREFLVSEAMHALGIPTTRALAAVATGETVQRETALPGAVLTRVAQSHIRVGTFQFFAAHLGAEHVTKLADYSIARHYPELAGEANPYLALLDAVIERQCALVAAWVGAGFIHGVMNTDNVAISGETIDYGPCAFMDRFAVNTMFSSIDANGRYAYGNQPSIMHWNMARFAEALLPAIHAISPDDVEKTKAMVADVTARFRIHWFALMRQKLGLLVPHDDNGALIDSLFDALEQHSLDFTLFFRALAALLRGDPRAMEAIVPTPDAMAPWIAQWWEQMEREAISPVEQADAMDRVNPLYIPRNHQVEAALQAAQAGDLAPFRTLLEVVRYPYTERLDWSAFAEPAPADGTPFVTFCGT